MNPQYHQTFWALNYPNQQKLIYDFIYYNDKIGRLKFILEAK